MEAKYYPLNSYFIPFKSVSKKIFKLIYLFYKFINNNNNNNFLNFKFLNYKANILCILANLSIDLRRILLKVFWYDSY